MNIDKIGVNISHCYGCGICAGTCPSDALSMKIIGEIGYYSPYKTKKCNNCGHCLRVCPWNGFDVNIINREIHHTNVNDIIGQYINCYTGYSADKHIRRESTSGGVITSLLIYMVKEKLVDGVVTVKSSGLYAEPFIAKTEEDIISAKGSKYISITLDKVIKEIKHFDGKLAIVGLPCHIQAIRKLESIDKIFKEKIIYCLGLMCSGTVGIKGTDILIGSFNVPRGHIKSMTYRGDSWPGYFKINTNNSIMIVPYPLYLSIIRTYLQPSCLVCWDALNEFSDISFGDAWLPHIKSQDNIGTSLLITRTTEGSALIRMAEMNNIIKLSNSNYFEVLNSQKGNVNFKKRILELRLQMFESMFGGRLKSYNVNLYQDKDVRNIVRTIALFIRTYLANDKRFNKIVDSIAIYILRRNIKLRSNIK